MKFNTIALSLTLLTLINGATHQHIARTNEGPMEALDMQPSVEGMPATQPIQITDPEPLTAPMPANAEVKVDDEASPAQNSEMRGNTMLAPNKDMSSNSMPIQNEEVNVNKMPVEIVEPNVESKNTVELRRRDDFDDERVKNKFRYGVANGVLEAISVAAFGNFLNQISHE